MQVSGITVEKAQEILDASIVAGEVASGSGHLILTNHGGVEQDAGLVVQDLSDLVENLTIDAARHLIIHFEDGSTADVGALDGIEDIQVFTASGTWTKPTFCTELELFMLGGGGQGGSGRRGAVSTVRLGGNGGNMGDILRPILTGADIPATAAVAIGAGGSASVGQATDSTNGADGSGGGDTTFGTGAALLRAKGGYGGKGGTPVSVAQPKSTYGHTSGGAGTQSVGAASTSTPEQGGGGCGGSADAANATYNGGAGGPSWEGTGTPTTGGATNVAGTAGVASAKKQLGYGGGGGGFNANGGNGGNYGAGGGGGGGSTNGTTSGKGGNGAQGILIAISRY